LFLFISPFIASAQESAPQESPSYFANPLFNSMLALIIVLLIIIVALTQVLKNIGSGDFLENKYKKKNENVNGGNSGGIKSLALFFFLLTALSTHAQNSGSWQVGGLQQGTFFFMLSVVLVEGIVIFVLYRLIMDLTKSDAPAVVVPKVKKRSILEKINASVDIEKEHDIMLGHEYDGIRELDNDLPPWWKYGFYVTIVFAFIYMISYHIAGTGDLQAVEYEKSVAQAKIEIEEYMKNAANNVDETTVKMLGEADIAKGKDIFITNCSTCHGKEGQGGVGPNLTDAYWLHSGDLADIFKSIKYGWVDKGMKSWKEDLSPVQIAQITSFIKSINGSNPAGAKAPQGDVYKEEAAPADSAKVKTDSLVVVKQDTLK
jgi:cytochrome c oxidase cbb3-type subunit 3